MLFEQLCGIHISGIVNLVLLGFFIHVNIASKSGLFDHRLLDKIKALTMAPPSASAESNLDVDYVLSYRFSSEGAWPADLSSSAQKLIGPNQIREKQFRAFKISSEHWPMSVSKQKSEMERIQPS